MKSSPLPKPYLAYVKEHFTYDPKTGSLLLDGQECIRLYDGHPPKVFIKPFADERGCYAPAARVAWFLHYGTWCVAPIYFRDRDFTNMTIGNLSLEADIPRVSQGKRQGNWHSRFKGVTLDLKEREKPWLARIHFRGRNYHLGRYTFEEDAALAYNAKAKELLGDLAVLNDVSKRKVAS